MWIEKLSIGVLRVLTPLGERYLNPSFAERLYLLWLFRNFETLPLKVLSAREQRRIDAMCAGHGFVSVRELNGMVNTPVLSTLEQRPPAANPVRPIRATPCHSLPQIVRALLKDGDAPRGMAIWG